jgi:hypothetical protein
VNFENLPSAQIGSDEDFAELAKGGDFLGRLQLYSKGKAINRGLILPGHWGIPESDEEIIDLGTSIDVVAFARRPKAIDMSDKEAIVTVYDRTSEAFQEIADRSLEQNSGCMYGPSFLVLERTSGRFLEFFCGTKSTRSEAKKIFSYMTLTAEDIKRRNLVNVEPHGPLPFTMKIKPVEKGSFAWHVPVVTSCSTPFSNVPSSEVIAREMQRFLAPKQDGPEKVAPAETTKRRAR